MNDIKPAGRPHRWDRPFGREIMRSRDIDRVLALPVISDIDPDDLPSDLSLRDIFANDARIKKFSRGDIIGTLEAKGNIPKE